MMYVCEVEGCDQPGVCLANVTDSAEGPWLRTCTFHCVEVVAMSWLEDLEL